MIPSLLLLLALKALTLKKRGGYSPLTTPPPLCDPAASRLLHHQTEKRTFCRECSKNSSIVINLAENAKKPRRWTLCI